MTGFCTHLCYYFQDLRDRTFASGDTPRANRFSPTLSHTAAHARSATMAAWFWSRAASSGVWFSKPFYINLFYSVRSFTDCVNSQLHSN